MDTQRTNKPSPPSSPVVQRQGASAKASPSTRVRGHDGRDIEVRATSTPPLKAVENPELEQTESLRAKKQTIRENVYELVEIPKSRFVRSYPNSLAGTWAKFKNDQQYEALLHELINYHYHSNLGPITLEFMDPPLKTKVSSLESLQEIIGLKLSTKSAVFSVVLANYIKFIFPELNTVSFGYQHGYTHIYSDDDITCTHETSYETTTEDGIRIQYTEHNKPIIQQQNPRGCTYAAVAMLILEHSGDTRSISMEELRDSYLDQAELRTQKISAAGLCPRITPCTKNLDWLAERIKENGSAIVGVKVPSGHVVVVDHISDTSVRLRDPYHAWDVEVIKPAFENSLIEAESIIQIERNTQASTP